MRLSSLWRREQDAPVVADQIQEAFDPQARAKEAHRIMLGLPQARFARALNELEFTRSLWVLREKRAGFVAMDWYDGDFTPDMKAALSGLIANRIGSSALYSAARQRLECGPQWTGWYVGQEHARSVRSVMDIMVAAELPHPGSIGGYTYHDRRGALQRLGPLGIHGALDVHTTEGVLPDNYLQPEGAQLKLIEDFAKTFMDQG